MCIASVGLCPLFIWPICSPCLICSARDAQTSLYTVQKPNVFKVWGSHRSIPSFGRFCMVSCLLSKNTSCGITVASSIVLRISLSARLAMFLQVNHASLCSCVFLVPDAFFFFFAVCRGLSWHVVSPAFLRRVSFSALRFSRLCCLFIFLLLIRSCSRCSLLLWCGLRWCHAWPPRLRFAKGQIRTCLEFVNTCKNSQCLKIIRQQKND